jgi:hypothetical protein
LQTQEPDFTEFSTLIIEYWTSAHKIFEFLDEASITPIVTQLGEGVFSLHNHDYRRPCALVLTIAALSAYRKSMIDRAKLYLYMADEHMKHADADTFKLEAVLCKFLMVNFHHL